SPSTWTSTGPGNSYGRDPCSVTLERVLCNRRAHRQPLRFSKGFDIGLSPTEARSGTGGTDTTKGGIGFVADGLFVDVNLAGFDLISQIHGGADVAEDPDR